MHEVSMMQNVLDIAIAEAQQHQAHKIELLTLNIGKLSGVVPEALEFAFEVLIQDTIAQDAQLEINTIPTVCHCRQCDRSFQPEDYIFICPSCECISSDILTGTELELVSVVVSE